METFCVHPLVERRHDGRRVVGVLQPQRMTQLMNRDQKQVDTYNQTRTAN